MSPIPGRKALWILAAITAIAAALRFYNLAWGAPFYHFHIDEHFVLGPADALRRDTREAVMAPKFFMYSPLMMYLINIVRSGYEIVSHPLDLTVPRDQVTYMVLARGIAATFGTATVLVAYATATRIAGRTAGVFAAFFLGFAVLHLRDSHFATTDMAMTFFSAVTVWLSVRAVEAPTFRSFAVAGAAAGAAVACKYTGVIALASVGVAWLLAARGKGPKWILTGFGALVSAVVTFFVLDPLVLLYPEKFMTDVREQVFEPLLGVTRPIFFAQFADIGSARLYWFTNLLFYSLGPMLEIVGIAGVVWLLARRDKRAAVAASFPIIYYAVAGRTVAPMIRYTLPLAPAFATAAAVLSADWLETRRLRPLAFVIIGATVLTTGLYALAYMNVFRQPDSRIQAARWLVENVPQNARVLVEPSQNTPPMGSYFTATNFNHDYVLWGGNSRPEAERERHDYYHLFALDAYRYLYNDRVSDDEKREYIASRLALVDWIVIDDTYVQWYDHLPAAQHAAVKEHYRDLLSGKSGFVLVRTFKVYPRLFGVNINDDKAEFSFRLFDHPRVYIFRRYRSRE